MTDIQHEELMRKVNHALRKIDWIYTVFNANDIPGMLKDIKRDTDRRKDDMECIGNNFSILKRCIQLDMSEKELVEALEQKIADSKERIVRLKKDLYHDDD